MEVNKDFEDFLYLLEKNKVRYLIIGGYAFVFHAKPKFTKDLDIWIKPEKENVIKTNIALEQFGSPFFLTLPIRKEEILQIGIAPNRIDLILNVQGVKFESCWRKRIRSKYGKVVVNWIDIDSLIKIKRKIKDERHQEDVKILLKAKEILKKKK